MDEYTLNIILLQIITDESISHSVRQLADEVFHSDGPLEAKIALVESLIEGDII